MGRKRCGKRRNCSLRAISPFPTVFSKGLFPRGFKRCHCMGKGLTLYLTTPHFDARKIHSCEKHREKRRNCLYQAISPFLTMFSTLYGTCTYFPLYMHFKMLSAISFNLDQSEILSSGNGLMHLQS